MALSENQTTAQPSLARKTSRISALGSGAAVLAALCLLPMLAVLYSAATTGTDTLSSLSQTVLPRYAATTVLLVALVALGTFAIGTGAAWLVSMTDFPGRRMFEVALVIPLAFPAYVMAYAYTHVLDHPGIVQSTLRDMTGWGPRDYWFPEIRSVGGAALMLTLVLYPYVYLLARTAFMGQSASTFFAARALGKTPTQAFFQVSLPMARPAIAAGVLLATMETIADFGTVSYFGVQTFATGIYQAWFSLGNRGAAAQLALCLLMFALLLAGLERAQRGKAGTAGKGQRFDVMQRQKLVGKRAAIAFAICFLPVCIGFVIPVLMLGTMASEYAHLLTTSRYLDFMWNSLTVSSVAALVTVTAAILIGFRARTYPSRSSNFILVGAGLGYAVPGGVIAVGLMVPMAAFDNALDAFMEARFGIDTGLLITGSMWLMVAAYMVRFMAVALNAYDSGMATIPAHYDAIVRTLGQPGHKLLLRVHLPVARASVLTALLIVFVDVMKELPATLILHPFNFQTLAVQAHRLAADERLFEAAVPSLVLVAFGLVPVLILCRSLGRESQHKLQPQAGGQTA